MRVNALNLCAAFCFISFGWGMTKHFRFIGKPTPAILITALLAVISAALHVIALSIRPRVWTTASIALYIVSAVLFWWAVSVTRGKLAACGQGCVSAHVIEDGPYAFIRHPFYAAYNLTWLAGFVATGWWPLFLTVLAMAAIYERAAREEERAFLTGALASEYRIYMTQAGRYIPFF